MVRKTLIASGESFEVYSHVFGSLEFVRVSDGAGVYFQGEDASDRRDDLDNAEKHAASLARLGAHPVDFVCVDYF